jgi:hypothetical protein
MPLQRNEFLPQDLIQVYTSPSGMTDIRTGQPYQAGGLMPGVYFDLTEQEAQNVGRNVLHTGRYRFVQVDSGATYSNIKKGTIGLMAPVPYDVNRVTSYDKGPGLLSNVSGLRPVVFLAPLTAAQISAGAWVFVEEGGVANVLAGTSITNSSKAIGDVINSVANGLVDDPTSQTIVPATIGYAMDLPVIGALGTFRVLLDLAPVQG